MNTNKHNSGLCFIRGQTKAKRERGALGKLSGCDK